MEKQHKEEKDKALEHDKVETIDRKDGYYNQNMSINRIKQPFRTAHR
ncbi:hypothetical protein PU682_03145 [Klebsiella pneumoniae]